MTYQLIVSTMNQHDDSLIEKMNIKSSSINLTHFLIMRLYWGIPL